MKNWGRGLRTVGIFGVFLAFAACASGPPQDIVVTGSLTAAETVNPDAQGRPSPIVVKIYHLKAKDKFELADFFALFDSPEATLGADMLGQEDFMMAPGESKPYDGAVNPETRYIGVIAAYRDINQAQWKTVVDMPEKNLVKFMQRNPLTIKVDRLAVSASAGN